MNLQVLDGLLLSVVQLETIQYICRQPIAPQGSDKKSLTQLKIGSGNSASRHSSIMDWVPEPTRSM